MIAIEDEEDVYCTCCGFPREIYLAMGHHPECIWTPPPRPPVIGLDMAEDDEHRRQIGLLMAQIMGPIENLQRLWSI